MNQSRPILTLYIQSGVGRQFSQFEGVNGLVCRVAVLHLQSLDHPFRCDLILVTVVQFHSVPDPLGSFHVRMGQFQGEHCLLGLSHSLVPQSLLNFHSWEKKTTNKHKKKKNRTVKLSCVTTGWFRIQMSNVLVWQEESGTHPPP